MKSNCSIPWLRARNLGVSWACPCQNTSGAKRCLEPISVPHFLLLDSSYTFSLENISRMELLPQESGIGRTAWQLREENSEGSLGQHPSQHSPSFLPEDKVLIMEKSRA